MVGRLTEDMTRLVDEIHAGRNDRRRLTQELTHAAAEMKAAVAGLRGTFAADLAGARAAWVGARAPVSRGVPAPEPAGAGRLPCAGPLPAQLFEGEGKGFKYCCQGTR